MKKITLLILLFTCWTPVFGQVKVKDKVRQKTENKAQQLRSIQEHWKKYQFLSVHFEQHVYKHLRKKTIKIQGKAFFKSPSSFRWMFLSPQNYQWIFDGKELLHFFPEKKFANRYLSGAKKVKELQELVDMVLGVDLLLKRYSIEAFEREKSSVKVILKPRFGADIKRATVLLDTQSNFVKEVLLEFDGGNSSRFVFSQQNPKPLSNQWLSLPEATEIKTVL